MWRRSGIKLALTGFLFVALIAWSLVQARGPVDSVQETTIAVTQLPIESAQTYALIHQGGPFAYEKDGVIFGNRERLLPIQKRGYYREYTARTPGSRDRGARRIVCGGQPRSPDTCYYTDDHYASFRRIVP